jgi:two-component system phosphate regulon sensor histidine kinase PhoR
MTWFFSRLLVLVAAALAGGGVGYLVGRGLQAPMMGILIGSACGSGLAGGFDALRGARLMHWLRGSQEGAAPRDKGFWGEVGYRFERALHLRGQQALQERGRLEQFLSAIEASPNGVLLLDENEQIEWCNSVAADHFNLDPIRDRKQRVTNLVRAPAFVTYLQAGRFDEPVQFPSPRGTLSVLVRQYGEGMRLVLSLDITERLRAEGMRRDFVANVSHEIRTPLTVLAGFVETLGNLPLTDVERRRVLELMRQQTSRMQTLVGDLLTLAQLEGSPRPAADRWVPLGKLLARVESDARALSAGRHALRFAQPEAVQIAGAEAELLSAVANVVNNAVRYTPEQGEIDVAFAVRPDGCGVIEVRDTGLGIAAEHLPRLTERFYRVDSSRSRETGGTGLGLSIVKHVLQRHGGELEVESAPGKGSRFRLIFPAARVRYLGSGVDAGRDSLPAPAAVPGEAVERR